MERERQLYSPRKLTEQEKYWLEFKNGETPHSLTLAPDCMRDIMRMDEPGTVIADLGGAWGRISAGITRMQLGIRGICADINAEELRYGKNKFLNVTFGLMDNARLAIKNEKVDIAIMVGVLGGVSLNERVEFLNETSCVLKSGGMLVVAEFEFRLHNSEDDRKYLRDAQITGDMGSRIVRKDGKIDGEILFVGKHFREQELRDLLSNAGFSHPHSIWVRRHDTAEIASPGDHEKKKSPQLTIWVRKP